MPEMSGERRVAPLILSHTNRMGIPLLNIPQHDTIIMASTLSPHPGSNTVRRISKY